MSNTKENSRVKMSSGLYQIDKLDETNFDGWRIQIKSVLVHCGLWGYVSGQIPKPTGTADPTDWIEKDEKALATLTLSIKTSQLLHVKHAETSKEALDKLVAVHSPCGPARKVSVFKSLLNLRMADGASMSAHLNNFFDLFEKLCELDIKLQDELLVILMLSSLPNSYENFIIAMESRDELPTITVLKTKLLEEKKRRQSTGAAYDGK